MFPHTSQILLVQRQHLADQGGRYPFVWLVTQQLLKNLGQAGVVFPQLDVK